MDKIWKCTFVVSCKTIHNCTSVVSCNSENRNNDQNNGKTKWDKTHSLVNYLIMSVTTYIVTWITQPNVHAFFMYVEKKRSWVKNHTKCVVEVESLGFDGCRESLGLNGVEKHLDRPRACAFVQHFPRISD